MLWAGLSIKSGRTKPSGGIGSWSVAPSHAGWYHASYGSSQESSEPQKESEPEVSSQTNAPADEEGTRKKNRRGKRGKAPGLLADGFAGRTRLAGALDHAQALLARVVAAAPTSCVAVPS